MKEIELKSVNKFYKPDVVALEDISLSIDQGAQWFRKKYNTETALRSDPPKLRRDVGAGRGCVRTDEETAPLLSKTVWNHAK